MMPDMPPAAIAEADSAGEFIVKEIETADGPRRYKLFVPSGYDKSKPAPLLVVLHGCTQDADDIARGTRFNAVAGEPAAFSSPIRSRRRSTTDSSAGTGSTPRISHATRVSPL